MIIKGIIGGIVDKTNNLLQSHDPLTIINDEIIPALNEVGDGFEKQECSGNEKDYLCGECDDGHFDGIKRTYRMEFCGRTGETRQRSRATANAGLAAQGIHDALPQGGGHPVFASS